MVEGNPEYASTSQEIKARAGQKEWEPNDYSSDPDYDADQMGAAIEALEMFDINPGYEIRTDGGQEFGFENIPDAYLERAASVFSGEYSESQDPRVADAEAHDFYGMMPEVDTDDIAARAGSIDVNTRERDWSTHEAEYDGEAMAAAIDAFESMRPGTTGEGEVDPRVAASSESEFGFDTPIHDNMGQHSIHRR